MPPMNRVLVPAVPSRAAGVLLTADTSERGNAG